jgi:hypothetical protein
VGKEMFGEKNKIISGLLPAPEASVAVVVEPIFVEKLCILINNEDIVLGYFKGIFVSQFM